MLLPHRHDPIVHAKLTAVLNEPSLYDEALHLLARRGHPVPKEVLARDFSQPYLSNQLVRDIGFRFIANRRNTSIFTNSPRNWSTSRIGFSNGDSVT
jgi:tryptophan 2,3-dioxygenase